MSKAVDRIWQWYNDTIYSDDQTNYDDGKGAAATPAAHGDDALPLFNAALPNNNA